MKTTIKIAFFLVLSSQLALAQQPITHNLYTSHPYLINPAMTGAKGSTNFILDVYNQWTSFTGAPRILTFAADGALKENMGIGLTLYSDQRNFLNHNIGMLNYAYHVKVNDDLGVSFGLGAGIVNNHIDFTGVFPGDVTDPLYNSDDYNATYFETSAGMFVRFKDLTVHLAMPQMLEQGKNFQAQYNLFALYDFSVNENLTMTPSVLVRAFPGNIMQEDINLMGTWDTKYWAQVGYRTDKSFLTSIGCNIKSIVLGYCFQVHMGEVSNFAAGTHEIILGYIIPSRFGKKPVDANADKVNIIASMLDNETQKPIAGKIQLRENDLLKTSCEAGITGICNMFIEPGLYSVTVKAKGYLPINEILDLREVEKGSEYPYKLTPIKLEKGIEFSLGDINFETDSDKLLPESLPILDDVVEVLLENPNILLEVGGHTDNVGGADHNQTLSEKRSASVVEYLVAHGVNADQLIPKGYGLTKPIASNNTVDGRRQNRRVVFTVLEMEKTAFIEKVKEKVVPEKKVEDKTPKVAADRIGVNVILIDGVNNSPVAGKVSLLQGDVVKKSTNTDNKGVGSIITVPAKYKVKVAAKGYLPVSKELDLSDVPMGSTHKHTIKLQKYTEGMVLEFGHINFETDKDVLLPESKTILDKAAEFFIANPNLVIEVGGHTDNQASAGYNLTLSQKRAVSATNYLISKGVKKEQLVAKGYGLTKPIATNTTIDGRKLNRRVVFTILEIK